MLKITDLVKHYSTGQKALHGVNLLVDEPHVVAIIGPSGAGKSTLIRCVNRLVEPTSGSIELDGVEITKLRRRALRRARRRMGMIFQEPMTALNPVYSIGEQVAEVLRHHRGMGRSEAKNAAIRLLERVEIPDPEQRFDSYPHEFS